MVYRNKYCFKASHLKAIGFKKFMREIRGDTGRPDDSVLRFRWLLVSTSFLTCSRYSGRLLIERIRCYE